MEKDTGLKVVSTSNFLNLIKEKDTPTELPEGEGN